MSHSTRSGSSRRTSSLAPSGSPVATTVWPPVLRKVVTRPRMASSSSITTILRPSLTPASTSRAAELSPRTMLPWPPANASPRRPQAAPPHRDPEERGRGVPPPRLPRRHDAGDRRQPEDDEGQPLLLLPEQGGDPLLLPRLLP